MKKTVTILLATLMMLGFASCLDQNRMDNGIRDNYSSEFPYNASVPAEISMADYR